MNRITRNTLMNDDAVVCRILMAPPLPAENRRNRNSQRNKICAANVITSERCTKPTHFNVADFLEHVRPVDSLYLGPLGLCAIPPYISTRWTKV